MIGVLALQGAFQKHLECLRLLQINCKPVKTLEQLHSCDALIMPGGESTAHHKLMGEGFWEGLKSFSKSKPMFGTCCGLILLSSEVEGDTMPTLNALDITVSRNAYGPQIASFEAEVKAQLEGQEKGIHGCFIRAPQITRVGKEVKVLATYQNIPVLVQQGHFLGCSFHPEVLLDVSLHRYFVESMLKSFSRL